MNLENRIDYSSDIYINNDSQTGFIDIKDHESSRHSDIDSFFDAFYNNINTINFFINAERLYTFIESNISNDDDTFGQSYSDLLQKNYNSLIGNLSRTLEQKLENFPNETDLNSESEDFIIEIEHKYSLRVLGDVIQNVYVKCFDKPYYMIGICNALLRYDLDEVKPWGIVLVSALINHPNESVKEYVVQLIDNWSDPSLIPILSTIEVSSEWLRKYINDVVKNIGESHVLSEKVFKN